jgi:hypothetical protein
VGRPWTTKELRYLRDSAGRVPAPEIQRTLGRSESSVRHQAEAHGYDLRCAKWRLAWCNDCATWRSRLRGDGTCEVCAAKRLADAAESRADALQRRLPMQGQDMPWGSRRLPMPPREKPPSTEGTPYERSTALQAWHKAEEQWELLRETRRYNAARKRAADIRKKLRKGRKDDGGEEPGSGKQPEHQHR